MRFYVPPNIDKDFTDAINSNLGTEYVINFNQLNLVRMIVPELDFRVKEDRVEGSKPLFVELNKLYLGDYIQDDTDTYIVVFLKNQKFPSCSKIQVQKCNYKVKVSRTQKQVIDNTGKIITPKGELVIADNIYSSVITGDYEFKSVNGSVGIVPKNQLAMQMQYNDTTKTINTDDFLFYFGSKYKVENVDYSQVSLDGTKGLLTVFSSKVV